MKSIRRKFKTIFRIINNTFNTLRNEGFSATFLMLKETSKKINGLKSNQEKQQVLNNISYIKAHFPTQAESDYQRQYEFKSDITFSIMVPLYNTPEVFLKEMIESVLKQTYGKWQLCLCDGSDKEHAYVESIVKQYANEDNRIHYQKLQNNYGIAGNTNACLEMASGNYIVLFDHDDILHSYALFKCMEKIDNEQADFIYTDEMTFIDEIENVVHIHFKPDFSPDTLRAHNYICHLSCFSRKLYKEVGNFSAEHDGSQDYDMILRLTEKAQHIAHIPEVLYYWRNHAGSVASDLSAKPYCKDSAIKALNDHLKRIGLAGTAIENQEPSTYKINYTILKDALISIIIPNKDHCELLSRCLNSIYSKTTYTNFEIIIIENNSEEEKTFTYYKDIENNHPNLSIVNWQGGWNYAAINNFGVSKARGEYILLLNNDTEVISPNWLEEMLMFIQRKDVGVVGAMLYYPDDTIQHAGLIMGINGTAGHAHKYMPRNSSGYTHRLAIPQNLSGVTGACLMTKKSLWEELGGLDEQFVVAFNDVDFCLRIREAGYLIVFTPYAQLYHYESKSRGQDDTADKQRRLTAEAELLKARWNVYLLPGGDPYYNKNLTRTNEQFSLDKI